LIILVMLVLRMTFHSHSSGPDRHRVIEQKLPNPNKKNYTPHAHCLKTISCLKSGGKHKEIILTYFLQHQIITDAYHPLSLCFGAIGTTYVCFPCENSSDVWCSTSFPLPCTPSNDGTRRCVPIRHKKHATHGIGHIP
jgi:hypothetical protein